MQSMAMFGIVHYHTTLTKYTVYKLVVCTEGTCSVFMEYPDDMY